MIALPKSAFITTLSSLIYPFIYIRDHKRHKVVKSFVSYMLDVIKSVMCVSCVILSKGWQTNNKPRLGLPIPPRCRRVNRRRIERGESTRREVLCLRGRQSAITATTTAFSDDGITAPVPQNADLWHSRALSGHLRRLERTLVLIDGTTATSCIVVTPNARSRCRGQS